MEDRLTSTGLLHAGQSISWPNIASGASINCLQCWQLNTISPWGGVGLGAVAGEGIVMIWEHSGHGADKPAPLSSTTRLLPHCGQSKVISAMLPPYLEWLVQLLHFVWPRRLSPENWCLGVENSVFFGFWGYFGVFLVIFGRETGTFSHFLA